MGWIAFCTWIILMVDICYVGYLRDQRKFLQAHKMKRFGEQVLLSVLLVSVTITIIENFL